MIKITTAIFVIAILTANPGVAGAQTADSIIQKHIAATGGADNWKKIRSVKKNCVRSSRGIDIPVTVTIVQGKGYKYESTINGMTSYSVITDKDGWSFNPTRNQKPDAMPPETVKLAQDLLDIQGPLIDYKQKGNKVVYLGTDDVEGTECHKLKISFPSGKEETYYVDISDFSLVRTVVKTQANGKEQISTATYGDYQRLPEGVVFPMSVDNGGNMTIKSIEVNKDINENTFQPAYK